MALYMPISLVDDGMSPERGGKVVQGSLQLTYFVLVLVLGL
jgi:hypothetical protein